MHFHFQLKYESLRHCVRKKCNQFQKVAFDKKFTRQTFASSCFDQRVQLLNISKQVDVSSHIVGALTRWGQKNITYQYIWMLSPTLQIGTFWQTSYVSCKFGCHLRYSGIEIFRCMSISESVLIAFSHIRIKKYRCCTLSSRSE